MNPDQLIKHFDRISEAPDAIPTIRQFILDLAVRGKLVEQDPKDEPASELIKRINTEKARLAKEGTIKLHTRIEVQRRQSDQIPGNWVLTTLGELVHKITDGTHKTPAYVSKGIPFISVKDFSGGRLDFSSTRFISPEEHRSLYKRCDPRRGDMLIGRIGTLGKAVLVDTDKEFSLFVSVGLIRFDHRWVSPTFFRILLNSPLVESEFDRIKVGGGTHTNKLNLGDLHTVVVLLPPLAEQHRVVAKVDELMAVCDQLSKAKGERDKRRNTVVAASLHHLNNCADGEQFRRHAGFYLNHIPCLTARMEHIQSLRRAVLNLAVRGSLIAQHEDDEPATDLLKRIGAEKALLVKNGQLKSSQAVVLPSQTELRFPLPAGWAVAHLQSLCVSITDGDHLPPPKTAEGVPFLVIGNVRSQTLDFAGCRYVSEEYYDALDAIRRPKKGDMLYTLVGSYGIPVIVKDNRPFCVQRHIGILRPSQFIDLEFLRRWLESPFVFNQATACATGIAQKTVPLAGLRRIVIPIPPFAEQQRIACKLGEIEALCDQIEKLLGSTEMEEGRLLESIIHAALHNSGFKEQPTSALN